MFFGAPPEFLSRIRFKLCSKRRIRQYLQSHEVKKLHMGAGSNMLAGWCNTDINPEMENAIFLDAIKPFPFDDCTFDYIFSEHMIEHIELREGIGLLKECSRVLKPAGKIRISTPDLRYLIDLYSPEKTEIQDREIARIVDQIFPDIGIYRDIFVINNFFRSWGHRFIYDYGLLKELMERAGFRDIVRCKVGESSDKNLAGLESHGRYISEDINRLQTFIAEGTKP